jgi:hypothetical protein
VVRRVRSTRRIAHDFPDALDLLVLSIRAGSLPAQAIVEIIPFLPPALRPSFVAVDDAMRRGDRFADALGQLRTRLGTLAQPLVDSLSAADRYGPPLARCSNDCHSRRASEARDTDAQQESSRATGDASGVVHVAFLRSLGDRPLAPRSLVVAAHLSDRTLPTETGHIMTNLLARAHAWYVADRDIDQDRGQATTEYALVMLGAAVIALLVVSWHQRRAPARSATRSGPRWVMALKVGANRAGDSRAAVSALLFMFCSARAVVVVVRSVGVGSRPARQRAAAVAAPSGVQRRVPPIERSRCGP